VLQRLLMWHIINALIIIIIMWENIFVMCHIAGSLDLTNVDCLELIWNNDQKTSDYVIINTKPLVSIVTICLMSIKFLLIN